MSVKDTVKKGAVFGAFVAGAATAFGAADQPKEEKAENTPHPIAQKAETSLPQEKIYQADDLTDFDDLFNQMHEDMDKQTAQMHHEAEVKIARMHQQADEKIQKLTAEHDRRVQEAQQKHAQKLQEAKERAQQKMNEVRKKMQQKQEEIKQHLQKHLKTEETTENTPVQPVRETEPVQKNDTKQVAALKLKERRNVRS